MPSCGALLTPHTPGNMSGVEPGTQVTHLSGMAALPGFDSNEGLPSEICPKPDKLNRHSKIDAVHTLMMQRYDILMEIGCM